MVHSGSHQESGHGETPEPQTLQEGEGLPPGAIITRMLSVKEHDQQWGCRGSLSSAFSGPDL